MHRPPRIVLKPHHRPIKHSETHGARIARSWSCRLISHNGDESDVQLMSESNLKLPQLCIYLIPQTSTAPGVGNYIRARMKEKPV